ncbi:unnamed protein product [Camellia sinensis]
MDEPTTGLDARAAAIVMRAVKNVAETGRTIVCTIHQPSIDIFETFGEAISGVQMIRNNYNPTTWTLEITSRSAEAQLCIDFVQVYRTLSCIILHLLVQMNSVLKLAFHKMVGDSSNPASGNSTCLIGEVLHTTCGISRSCLLHLCFFGILFWDQGRKINSQQGVFNALGSIFSATIFLGISNSLSVLPYVATERSRCMVSGLMHWLSVTVEVPYLLVQAIAFVIITYSMIGYYWSTCKVFWYFYAMFCTFLYFTYLGILFVALTPTFLVAAILQSALHNVEPVFWRSDSSIE